MSIYTPLFRVYTIIRRFRQKVISNLKTLNNFGFKILKILNKQTKFTTNLHKNNPVLVAVF